MRERERETSSFLCILQKATRPRSLTTLYYLPQQISRALSEAGQPKPRIELVLQYEVLSSQAVALSVVLQDWLLN